ncbi:ABC transporter transmembrane domain-containing protein [Alteromonas oceanisediminis]|uniref:ABC transporter transmembrane domain-containing protein n=1 Tax=Alteromonas oceanisediminis TaxID=2836180 RepID=UPI001BDB093D|nr:ABC transporter transmembrane domain-containing protein [Alteromonas oceanisediminis]MBT0585122.1 ATP-binding cassette domain-containing protein [Alteromonas oceanisediminis]
MSSSRNVVSWLLGFLSPYKAQVAGAIVALFVGALSWLSLGQGVRLAVDDGFVADNAARLNQLALLVLGIAMVASVATYFRFSLMTWLGERVSADIRKTVYAHLLSLNPEFFSQTRTGEVISRFTADTTVLQTVIGMGISMALRSSVTFIGALTLMLVSSPQLTLYVLLAVPCVLLPIKVLGKKVRLYAKLSQDRVADIGAYIDETLHEIQTVQAYSHEQADRKAFTQRVEDVMSTAKMRIHYRSLLIGSIMMISIIAVIIVAWIGAMDVIRGSMTAGELTAFMFYAVLAGGSVATISEVIGEIQKAAGASERLMGLLDARSHIAPNPFNASGTGRASFQKPHQEIPAIQFDNVSFSYPSEPNRQVLKQISLSITRGERVALVGPSGAGKSTLYQLLLRFYDAQQGHIMLDGHPIHALPIDDLRHQFALVPQESVIFAMSVFENIRYGQPDATIEQVQAAAITAQADEFIRNLEQGYDTDLGERGIKLSGGQKQRISIARAILANRPILLLDEATSALDAVSEQQVKVGLDNLMQNKTTLIIAHRLSTVINADRIIVLQEGQIIAEGDHNTLMEQSALYREHAQLQLMS